MIKINTKSVEYILKVTPAEQNIMLVGRHGIGKSKIIENYFSGRWQLLVVFSGD